MVLKVYMKGSVVRIQQSGTTGDVNQGSKPANTFVFRKLAIELWMFVHNIARKQLFQLQAYVEILASFWWLRAVVFFFLLRNFRVCISVKLMLSYFATKLSQT